MDKLEITRQATKQDTGMNRTTHLLTPKSIGQKTGTSKIPKNVIKKAVQTALKHEYQNLNSGSLQEKPVQIERGGNKSKQ